MIKPRHLSPVTETTVTPAKTVEAQDSNTQLLQVLEWRIKYLNAQLAVIRRRAADELPPRKIAYVCYPNTADVQRQIQRGESSV